MIARNDSGINSKPGKMLDQEDFMNMFIGS